MADPPGIKRVAMESTGVYWKPLWNVLERGGQLELLLLNPQHVKALPGHKTDRVDAAASVRAGARQLRSPDEIRELRDLTRRQTHLVADRNSISNRIHRLLQGANIKVSSVFGKVTTRTFRSILEGLATAEWTRPEALAMLATHKRVRAKREQLARALRGCVVTDHFRFLLRELLEELDRLTAKIDLLETRIEERMQPHSEIVGRCCEMPGVGRLTAWTLIAEIGTDMSRFPSAGHLSWVGLCPGNAASGGKRHSGRTGKGNTYLRRAMVEAAWAAARITSQRTFFTTLFFRLSRRAGMKKAAVALAHRLLQALYLMLRDHTRYREQGADYFDRLHPERTRNRLKARLENLGFDVALTPKTSS
jgi:transposase